MLTTAGCGVSLDGTRTDLSLSPDFDGRSVYVLWGSQPLPSEVRGSVTITDIYGQQKRTDAEDIRLTESPPVYIDLSCGSILS